MIDKIKLWWKFEGRYYHRDFTNGIKNLWKWFPVIWRDRDWDSNFIYEILIHKLEKQATYIHKHGNHVSAERDAEKMFLCARLARIQQEELYMDEYYDTYEMKWEFVPTDETEKWFTMETEITSENFIDYFAKYPRQYRLIDKTDKEKNEIAREIAYRNQERSRKLLFKIMEENIERWWN
jgi:hypothetical protein